MRMKAAGLNSMARFSRVISDLNLGLCLKLNLNFKARYSSLSGNGCLRLRSRCTPRLLRGVSDPVSRGNVASLFLNPSFVAGFRFGGFGKWSGIENGMGFTFRRDAVDEVKGIGSEEVATNTSSDSSILSVNIECHGDQADPLMESLMSFGALSCSVEDANYGNENEEQIFSSGPVPWSETRVLWNESRITALFSLGDDVHEAVKLAAEAAGLTSMPKYDISQVKNDDWVEQFKQNFNPLFIDQGLWIIPHWCKPVDPSAVNVYLDPGLAFGTGDHPTTRLCLKFLLKEVKGGEIVMDYGCGSGILGLTALKLGASRAVGVDIDPLSISSSAFNTSLNGYDSSLFPIFISEKSQSNGEKESEENENVYMDPVPKGLFADLMNNGTKLSKNDGEYDIVIANILVNPLIDLSDRILSYSRRGGKIALSGIINNQVNQVISAYEKQLKVTQVTEEDGWSCIQGTKI